MPFPKPGGGSGLDQLTGDVTAGPGVGSQAATLEATANVESVIAANTTVAGAVQKTATPGGDLAGTGSTYSTPELIAVGTAGTVGDASHYPVVTTDTKGRVTGMVATAVPGGTPATTVTGPDAFGAAAVVGTSTLYAREDHDHGLPAAPAVPTPATTVTGPDVFGAAAVVGTGTEYARIDHDHGLPAAPADIPLSTVTTAGDLIVGTGAGTVGRLGIGANGDVLTVAAGALGYAAPATGVDLLQFFQSTLPSSQSWTSVAYGNGAFVAVATGPSTTAAYSTNGGQTWTASTLPSSQTWQSVAYGNGAFVAVATGPSTAAAYSTNGGQTWTASTLPSSQDWYSVAYGNGTFVAVANGSSTAAAYTQIVALASANTATVSSQSVTSGTAFTPSTASNSTVYFQINAASAGSYTLTMGPTTGAENTIGSAVAMVAGSDALVSLVVPRSWLVVLTLTTVTLAGTTVVAM